MEIEPLVVEPAIAGEPAAAPLPPSPDKDDVVFVETKMLSVSAGERMPAEPQAAAADAQPWDEALEPLPTTPHPAEAEASAIESAPVAVASEAEPAPEPEAQLEATLEFLSSDPPPAVSQAGGDPVISQVEQDLESLSVVLVDLDSVSSPQPGGPPAGVSIEPPPEPRDIALAEAEQPIAQAPAHLESSLGPAPAAAAGAALPMEQTPVRASADGDDPAGFLLEPAPAAAAAPPRPELDAAKVKAAVAAIANELFAPDSVATPAASAAAPPTQHAACDPLPALTAMSEEERIALFT
jgi:hypothetical protein